MSKIISIRRNALAISSRGSSREETIAPQDGRQELDAGAVMRLIEPLPATDRESVEQVHVYPDAQLTDCSFLSCLPSIPSLSLFGKKIRSTRGIAGASLVKLILETGSPNKTDLDEIDRTHIRFLRIGAPRLPDLGRINAVTSLRELEILGGAFSSFAQIKESRLDSCTLVHRTLGEISDVDEVSKLEELWLARCQNLVGFSGSANRIRRLVIEACNKFDMKTLGMAGGLTRLRIMGCKKPFDLADIAIAEQLEEITITNSAVVLESPVKLRSEALRKLWISPCRNERLRSTSEANPRVRISNGDASFVGGERVSE